MISKKRPDLSVTRTKPEDHRNVRSIREKNWTFLKSTDHADVKVSVKLATNFKLCDILFTWWSTLE